MREEGVDPDVVETTYYADVCYVGQAHYIEVPLSLHEPDSMLRRVYDTFCSLHDKIHGHSTRGPARFVNVRVVQRAGNTPPGGCVPLRSVGRASKGTRRILFDGAGTDVAVDILHRDDLAPHHVIRGPAMVEQSDTTTVIEPGCRGAVTEDLVLILSREP
jgi:N-methylhydantoinase A/oxoprolinase/acetone carboxylase beta subunit